MRLHSEWYSQTLDFFVAGQVKNYLPPWESITQDPVILSAVQQYNIEFEEKPPLQTLLPKKFFFSLSNRAERLLTMKLSNFSIKEL